MCGIGLIVTGISVLSGGNQEVCVSNSSGKVELKNLLNVLKRRGPDSCDVRTICVRKAETTTLENCDNDIQLHNNDNAVTIQFLGTTLQLRGDRDVVQPLHDSENNILVYNGEVFGGLQVAPQENDTEIIFSRLSECCTCSCHSKSNSETCACIVISDLHTTVPEVLSRIRGPWAMIYWQAKSRTLWFGRDALGRRSLLVHRPSTVDPRFLLSSVAPAENQLESFSYWDELSCCIFSIHISDFKSSEEASGVHGFMKTHAWEDTLLTKLIRWNRQEESENSDERNYQQESTSELVLKVLTESVKRRTSYIRLNQSSCVETEAEQQQAPVAVLFSGGIDSMLLAALAHICIDPTYVIDLLNVSFEGSSAPDRITAVAGLTELQNFAPNRSWRLVEVDEELGRHENLISGLICPSQTYMDSNIGTALWSAAGGYGSIYKENEKEKIKYHSQSRVVLVGSGADEQCGGYSRYRTKFKLGGCVAMEAEMRLDMQRLWKRNLGRDDRCIGDQGKEARFPFLDEDVINTLLDLPLHEIADLRQEIGVGDKKILREVARLIGLSGCATLPKRAIQFGSGIARQSNRRNFGSNRAANKACAGSVRI